MAETSVTSNLGWDNFFSTTTTGALTATTTTIPLATPPTPTEGFLVLDPGGANEIIFYNSVSGNSVIVPTTDDRGRGDSTAQAHSSGITVKMNTVGMMFEALQSGLALTNASVTPAKWTNPYCFRAYASATTTLTDSDYVKIAFATEQYDYNNNFAASTYTAPVAGVYHFDALVTHASGSSTPVEALTTLYKNGTVIAWGPDGKADTTVASGFGVNADLLLAANDTIDVYHYQNSAGNELATNDALKTWFSGHLVHSV